MKIKACFLGLETIRFGCQCSEPNARALTHTQTHHWDLTFKFCINSKHNNHLLNWKYKLLVYYTFHSMFVDNNNNSTKHNWQNAKRTSFGNRIESTLYSLEYPLSKIEFAPKSILKMLHSSILWIPEPVGQFNCSFIFVRNESQSTHPYLGAWGTESCTLNICICIISNWNGHFINFKYV